MSDYNARRADFTDDEVRTAYAAGKAANADAPYAHMAKVLTALNRGEVRRNRAREWALLVQSGGVDPLGDYMGADTLRAHRHQSVQNNRLRRENRMLADELNGREEFIQGVQIALERMSPDRFYSTARSLVQDAAGTPCTVELLLSDLQIGKIGGEYNTEIAKARLAEYTRAAIFQIEQKVAAGYRVERIVLAILGDIIESDKKHKNSARATDSGTATQIADAIQYLHELVVIPLASLDIDMDIICVTG